MIMLKKIIKIHKFLLRFFWWCCSFAAPLDEPPLGVTDVKIIWPISFVVKRLLSGRKVSGSNPGSVVSDAVSPAARHRSGVSSELCCRGA